jgi:N-acetylglucosamine-6-sulfatase
MTRWLRSCLVVTLCAVAVVGNRVVSADEDLHSVLRLPVEAPRPPDVVLILTDDQRPDTLGRMPTVRRQLRAKGLRFSRTIAPTATCCPSRASLATGLFAHETGVWGNTPPYGGWRSFYDNGNEDRTLAKALHARGYRTGLFGKYANGYAHNEAGFPAGHIPPGWDTFLTFADSTGSYYDYSLTDGSRYRWASNDYSTDVLGARAARFIRETAPEDPLFVMFTPYAPHKPYRPARRHLYQLAHKLPAYRPPSVTEDVSDKPSFLSSRPRVRQKTIDRIRTRQQEQLLSVDEAVARILRALRKSGRLDNTLLVFMSDNGLMIGDHHTVGKNLPYRSATDVPLIIRWDGHTPRVAVDDRVAANIDVTTTISNATGAGMTTSGLDLFGRVERTELLLEGRQWQRKDGSVPHPAYCGLRSERYLFVHWADGVEEIYDYAIDRYETQNRAADATYAGVVEQLRRTTRERCSPVPPGFTWGEETAS